jgi:hypothetical protein
MSLLGFDTLHRMHPDRAEAIAALEVAIRRTLARNPTSAIEDQRLSQQTKLGVAEVGQFLVELMRESALESRVAWVCPTLHGTVREENDLSALPTDLECPVCGQSHRYDPAQIEVFFVATPSLLQSADT